MLRITTATLGRAATRRCAASIPLRFGMAMSSTTTSGSVASACSTACPPSEASATTLKPGWLSSSSRRPLRITVWSSANRMRILFACVCVSIGLAVVERQFHGQQRSGAARGMHPAAPAELGHAFLDAEQSHAGVLLKVKAFPVVLDGEHQAAGLLAHADSNLAGLRMA